MLIEFRVSNYRSVGEEQVISLVPATNQKEYPENILENGKYRALNVLAFYGPNSGGKSNLLLAMSLLDRLISLSGRLQSTTPLPYDPFRFREGWDKKPTTFEITFILNTYRYRFGLEFSKDQVLSEWLFRKGTGREVNLFQRNGELIDVGPGFLGGKKLIDTAIEATRINGLFLSVCDVFNISEAKQILKWFKNFNMLDGLNTEEKETETVELWQQQTYRDSIKPFLFSLNLSLKDIGVELAEFKETDLPEGLPLEIRTELLNRLENRLRYSVISSHQFYNEAGNPVSIKHFKFDELESAGTKKIFHLCGPILWALINGGVLIVDEIDAKLHSELTLKTIQVFLNTETNPNGAQLIFATHDTTLLTHLKLRRDQIYFTEKNKWEATEIFSLSDYVYFNRTDGKVIPERDRPDADKEKRYREGRYGATPSLNKLFFNISLQPNGAKS